MRRTRLLMIAIASFFGTIIGEGLVRRAIALHPLIYKLCDRIPKTPPLSQ
jgi:hypothetical protein